MSASSWAQAERDRQQVAREARDLPKEPTSAWVKGVVALVTLAWLGVLVWQAFVLPDRVPQHWTNGNVPDRWAGRTEALVVSLALPLLFAYPLPLLSRLVTAWPDGLNVPNKEWWLQTPERVVRFERLLREDLWLCTAWMLVIFVAGDVLITIAAGRPGGVISMAPMAVLVAVMLVAMIGYIVWMCRGRYAEDPSL